MSNQTIRFRIEFKGAVPSHYPHAVKIPAKDEEEATMWAKKQLEAWGIDPKRSNFSVRRIDDQPVVTESQDKTDVSVKKDKSKKAKK